MRIVADQRCLEVEPDHEGGQEVCTRLALIRRRQIELGQLLLRLERKRHFALHGCASLAAWTRLVGLGEIETRQLLNIALAIEAAHDLKWHLTARRISFDAAALLGTLARADQARVRHALVEDIEPPDWDEWLRAAQTSTLTDFRKLVRRERERLRQRTEVVDVVITCREQTRDDFERARQIASRRRQRMLSAGETLTEVTDHYLDSFDPLRKAQRLGEREDRNTQAPLTTGSGQGPGKRYVPASVKHAVRLRSGDCCEVPGCPNATFLDFAHVVPHRDGGTQTEDNLLLLCSRHHFLFDSGTLRLLERRPNGVAFASQHGDRFEPSGETALAAGPDPPRVRVP